jgi:DNA-binding transcriptional LysR family regulator
MERIRRLAAFWNWLPAFRAVAEVQHLPSAAEEFRISPSALSRSVRQLEEHLGIELFDREGRLLLNDHGRELLGVIRKAMALVDEGVENINSRVFSGTVRIAARGSFASVLVVPAAIALRSLHPKLVPEVHSMSAANVNTELHAVRMDLAVLDDPIPDEGLRVEKLCELTYGVYCGRGHRLFEVPEPSQEQILGEAFVGPLPGQNDHWPPETARFVGARFEVLHHGLELCASGSYLAVLPDRIARDAGRDLRRLAFQDLRPTTVYAVYREPVGDRTKIDLVLDAIRSAACA